MGSDAFADKLEAEKARSTLQLLFKAARLLNERAIAYVVRADPARFELVAENPLGDEAFASPVICGGRLYLRVATRSGERRQEWLYCIGAPG